MAYARAVTVPRRHGGAQRVRKRDSMSQNGAPRVLLMWPTWATNSIPASDGQILVTLTVSLV